MKRIFYIIGHRSTIIKKENNQTQSCSRIQNLLAILQWLSDINHISKKGGEEDIITQTLIVEQDACRTVPKFLNRKDDFPHLKVEYLQENDSGPYNRSRVFNIGVRKLIQSFSASVDDIIIFADNDVFLDTFEIYSALKQIVSQETGENIPVFSPYKEIYDLPQGMARETVAGLMMYSNDPNSSFVYGMEQRKGINFAGGIVGMTLRYFLQLGGWDETFKGWGYEDAAMSHLIGRVSKKEESIVKTFPLRAYHLWHERDPVTATKEAQKKRNHKVLLHLKMSNDDTIESRRIYMRTTFGLAKNRK